MKHGGVKLEESAYVCVPVCVRQHCDAPVIKAPAICQWWTSHAWHLMKFCVAWQPCRPLSVFFMHLFINKCRSSFFLSTFLSRLSLIRHRHRGNLLHTDFGLNQRSRGDGGRKPVACDDEKGEASFTQASLLSCTNKPKHVTIILHLSNHICIWFRSCSFQNKNGGS